MLIPRAQRLPAKALANYIHLGINFNTLRLASFCRRHPLITCAVFILALRGDWEPPHLFGVEPPQPRLEAVRVVDMSASNSWAEFAATFRRTRPAYQEHEGAKADLKKLVPEDAKEAVGHGLRARRSKSGAISFDLLDLEAGHAALQ